MCRVRAKSGNSLRGSCQNCHTLYGEGGHIGPDLTGANRDNIDYLLDNIVDPSAVIDASFRMSIVALNDGRILNGIITSRTEQILKVQTPTELVTIEMSDVKKIRESTQSMMPEGLLQTFTAEQLRDLFAYLMNPTQVPLPDQMNHEKK